MRIFFFLFFSIALAGCMVGPDFHAPAGPQTTRYTETPLPAKTITANTASSQGKAQYFLRGGQVPQDWWTMFRSKPLNKLICEGLANNANLQAAKAALRQAQTIREANFGNLLLPSVDGQFSGERRRTSNSSSGSSFSGGNISTLYNASVGVSYVLDLFGGARRELEGYSAQVDYQRFQLEATTLALTSNIVTTAITMASLEAQINATKAILNAQKSQLAIVNKQLALGSASGADVASQETQVAQTRALLPPLVQSLTQSRNALAVLVGTLPSESHLPTFDLNHLSLPTRLPLSLPSCLVRQRPDIRAQEALLHTASAQIGVATANLFPQVSLSGNYGWNGNNLAHLFSPANIVWNYGSGLLQPVFHGGALLAQRRAAIAAYEQAAAVYRQTVLQAFQNVADTLAALNYDAMTLAAQTQAENAAQKTLSITEKQYHLGATSYLALLNAQRQYQQTSINRIQAQAARLADTAALYQALGGGWWNHEVSKPRSTSTITYRSF